METPTHILTPRTGHCLQNKKSENNTEEESFERELELKRINPLFHHIELLAGIEEIDERIQGGRNFEIASDGGHDPESGISTYGWIVLIDKQPIAKGRGPAAAHPTMAESFRAEGFGIASAGAFLQTLIRHFAVQVQHFNWHLFVDNQAMIKRMESYDNKIPNSGWNLRADADITNFAFGTIQELQPIFHHVKSHQDTKVSDKPPPFDAQINIIADELATRQRVLMTEPMTHMEGLGCTLHIDGIPITRDSQKWILDFSSRIPMMDYYHRKLKWTENTFHSIHWDIQHTVLRGYSENDQRRILKFCHDWLPTNKRLFREGQMPSAKCPLCNCLEETNVHLLECQHPSQQNIREDLYFYMQKDIHNMGNGELNNLMELALQESTVNPHWKPDLAHVSEHLSRFIREQGSIGWQELYRGRIAKSIVTVMDTNYQNANANRLQYTGKRWTRALLRNIWNTVLKLWKNRNDIVYNLDKNIQEMAIKENLNNRIERCFAQYNDLDLHDRNIVFAKSQEEVMAEDRRYITAWLRIAERTIKTAQQERITKKNKSRHIMESFINWHPKQKEKKPKGRPATWAHNLRPD
jgi:hypothetical protein